MSKAILQAITLSVSAMATVTWAQPALFLNDFNGNTVNIFDNLPGDLDPTQGIVNYSGDLGDWKYNFEVGLTKPVYGSANRPRMHLTSLNMTSRAGGDLQITFFDDGFTGPQPTAKYRTEFGGVTAGKVSAQTYYTSLADQILLADSGILGKGAFAFEETSPFITTDAPYALTLTTLISHKRKGVTSFDLDLRGMRDRNPPSAPYAGLGLMFTGLLLSMLRFKSKKAFRFM